MVRPRGDGTAQKTLPSGKTNPPPGVFVKKNTTMNDRLTHDERKVLPDSVYGLPERREYPMPDAAHVRAAEAYFRYCPEDLKPQLARAILQKAKEYGVDVESPTVLSFAGQ